MLGLYVSSRFHFLSHVFGVAEVVIHNGKFDWQRVAKCKRCGKVLFTYSVGV